MHHRAKLSDDTVRQMRKDYKPWVFGMHRCANKYGCALSTVRDIVTYSTRKDVK